MGRHTWMDTHAPGIGGPLRRNIQQIDHREKCVTAHEDK